MFDFNVFVVLTLYEDKANNTMTAMTAFNLPHNRKRFRKGVGGVTEEPTINSQEPTPALADRSTTENKADYIVLTLNEEVKDSENMWQFRTRPRTSDILLGHQGTERISAKQCNLTIDDDKYCI
jgi:hypothetical protein